MYILPETELIQAKQISKDKNTTTFVIEPLLPGYGMTLGNALRRVLLSSLTGAAITSIKFEGTSHEFSTIKGVKEDVIELILNLKSVKVQLHGDEPAIVKLSKKGPGEVTVKDFKPNSHVAFSDPNDVIANLDKNGVLNFEVKVEKGRGYVPVERRIEEKPVLGTICIDAIFTPIKRVHYEVENTRVGGMTNYDKLTIDLTTDGTIDALNSILSAIQILLDHFGLVTQLFTVPIKNSKSNQGKTKPAQDLSESKSVAKKKTKSTDVSKAKSDDKKTASKSSAKKIK